MNTLIINLVGRSGTGKTTLARGLERMGCNVIQSYTTRPPREDNEYGHTFIENYEIYLDTKSNSKTGYVSEIYDKLRYKTYFKDDMIAYFNSYKSGHHYFATDGQVMRNTINIYVVDPLGANMVKDFYKDSKDIKVITIKLDNTDDVIKGRLWKRDGNLSRFYEDLELFKNIDYDMLLRN